MQTSKKDDALLEACTVTLAAFIEHDTPANRAALEQARLRFYEAVQAEFRVIW
jgi:hypothetical protein